MIKSTLSLSPLVGVNALPNHPASPITLELMAYVIQGPPSGGSGTLTEVVDGLFVFGGAVVPGYGFDEIAPGIFAYGGDLQYESNGLPIPPPGVSDNASPGMYAMQ